MPADLRRSSGTGPRSRAGPAPDLAHRSSARLILWRQAFPGFGPLQFSAPRLALLADRMIIKVPETSLLNN